MYQHVNFINKDAFDTFVALVLGFPCLAQFVTTLQISFNTKGLDPDFCCRLCRLLKALENLHCLNISYQHNDKDFVSRFSRLGKSLQAACKQLHLKPIPAHSELTVRYIPLLFITTLLVFG